MLQRAFILCCLQRCNHFDISRSARQLQAPSRTQPQAAAYVDVHTGENAYARREMCHRDVESMQCCRQQQQPQANWKWIGESVAVTTTMAQRWALPWNMRWAWAWAWARMMIYRGMPHALQVRGNVQGRRVDDTEHACMVQPTAAVTGRQVFGS